MRILKTKRAVALVLAFAALMPQTCLRPLSAGPKSPAAPLTETPAGAQEPAMERGQKTPASAISVEMARVNLEVLVTDRDGRVLSGLVRENFRGLDNGKPQAITHFAPLSAPTIIPKRAEASNEVSP